MIQYLDWQLWKLSSQEYQVPIIFQVFRDRDFQTFFPPSPNGPTYFGGKKAFKLSLPIPFVSLIKHLTSLWSVTFLQFYNIRDDPKRV